AYRDGKGVPRDLDKAAEWMRKASDKNVGWAKNELFDILWRIGTPEAHEEMISVATAFAEAGDGNAMGRLGRAYRDGKGVPRDLDKAAEWMRKASDKNVGWAKNELFDILWKINTPESHKEMISVAKVFAEAGDGGAMGRLGRAYRDGRGVEQDLDKAAEWMRKAADKNVKWAKNELCDILWKMNTADSLAEMLELVVPLAESGDGRAMNQLARAYRDGKGVEKDLDKAAEWMEKAAKKNIWWAKNELFNILLDLDTYESHTSMISIATKFAMEGDGSAMLHLGRMYRDGKGTEKDLDKAVEWMKKAVEKNTGRAKLELTDVLLARGSKEDEAKAFVLCNELAEAGNAGGYGRLARMYRDGKGTEINLKKARELMKIAAESGIGWAKREYEQIDMMIDR
ncbi:MAG: hypothetical protein LHW41_09590, partial [Candidatus Cloacimonetes bacterium]|nr:hypothetical protein [Candidatus Cloacimonadota bacterium]